MTRIVDNLNKQKFTTNIDNEVDGEKRRNAELQKKKNIASVEPFWQDFNSSTVTDICREKEQGQIRNKSMNRSRGPSQPTIMQDH